MTTKTAPAALRKPYIGKMIKRLHNETSYVQITLKKEGYEKLVISFDSYNTILSMGDNYKCVVCGKLLHLVQDVKDLHISTAEHRRTLDKYPHDQEFSHHLIRKLKEPRSFCTICNVIVENDKLIRHTSSEAHMQELERAIIRGQTYTVDR